MNTAQHALGRIRANLEKDLETLGRAEHTPGFRRGLREALTRVTELEDATATG
ncbi:hypothetical protein G6038_21700 [Rhodococcus sp. 14C212]|uniref:hypothetical protein n=1 Tax=Rhodococcus sp. 14C212 TaxID=2711209 RepID=UPI0013EAE395|nr:hypothetical protein [Rhodococcus sp. 14C212]NGP08042.1 hypothetical protein [Rhodococcus sp. 14C212]